MSRRVLTITAGIIVALVCFVLLYAILHVSATNKEVSLKQRKTYSFQHNYVTNYQAYEYRMLGDILTREAEACDRMHLSKAERSERLRAVKKACLEEMRRVQSSEFTSTFHPPPTD